MKACSRRMKDKPYKTVYNIPSSTDQYLNTTKNSYKPSRQRQLSRLKTPQWVVYCTSMENWVWNHRTAQSLVWEPSLLSQSPMERREPGEEVRKPASEAVLTSTCVPWCLPTLSLRQGNRKLNKMNQRLKHTQEEIQMLNKMLFFSKGGSER